MPDDDHPDTDLASDRLDGAGQFAEFIFGEDTPETRKKIYRAVEAGIVPAGRWATRLFGSKRAVRAAIETALTVAPPPTPQPAKPPAPVPLPKSGERNSVPPPRRGPGRPR